MIELTKAQSRALARAKRAVADAGDLDQVRTALLHVHGIVGDSGMNDWFASGRIIDDVPKFGPEPYHLNYVWSWDRERVLVQPECGGFDEVCFRERSDVLQNLCDDVSGSENLVELRDALNALQEYLSDTELPDVADHVDLNDLPCFGGDVVTLPGIYS